MRHTGGLKVHLSPVEVVGFPEPLANRCDLAPSLDNKPLPEADPREVGEVLVFWTLGPLDKLPHITDI